MILKDSAFITQEISEKYDGFYSTMLTCYTYLANEVDYTENLPLYINIEVQEQSSKKHNNEYFKRMASYLEKALKDINDTVRLYLQGLDIME